MPVKFVLGATDWLAAMASWFQNLESSARCSTTAVSANAAVVASVAAEMAMALMNFFIESSMQTVPAGTGWFSLLRQAACGGLSACQQAGPM
jgi:hypothetical protein